MTSIDIAVESRRPACRRRWPPGSGGERGGVVRGGLGPGGGADAQEVRPHAGLDRRRHGTGDPVPA